MTENPDGTRGEVCSTPGCIRGSFHKVPDECSTPETEPPTGQFYEPQDRFTRMGDLLTEVLPQLDEYQEGDRCIIFMTDHQRSGITIHGYDEAVEAIADLFVHLKSIMKANGSDLEFIGIPNSLEGLED